MNDLRALLKTPVDYYLRRDELAWKKNVLMTGAPGRTHTFWSRHEMWKMATKFGDFRQDVGGTAPGLVKRLDALLDPTNTGKATYRGGARVQSESVLRTIYRYLEQQYNVRGAFPPIHARFLADRYLPREGDSIVVDPCAGWSGRLLGTLCVPRAGHVRYYGVDPNKHNREAYAGVLRRVRVWLKREIGAPRSGRVFVQPFEKWIHSRTAAGLQGRVSLVMTSPPYWTAEVYDTQSKRQSANRYPDYKAWREHFLTPLVRGAFDLLKPGGVFCLNIADVTGATLERDTRRISREVGFLSHDFFKLAMSRSVGTRRGKPRHAVQVDGVPYKHEPVFVFRKP
jgi:hypothetical protein